MSCVMRMRLDPITEEYLNILRDGKGKVLPSEACHILGEKHKCSPYDIMSLVACDMMRMKEGPR